MKFKVKDIKENAVDIELSEGKLMLNGKVLDADLVKLPSGQYHAIQDNKTYKLEVVESDFSEKKFKVKVNNQLFELSLEDGLDMLLTDMGMSTANSEQIDKVIAPMPGLVLDIMVVPGQEIKKGDSLVILEAMKMENIIKSAGNGIVKEVLVEKNDAIEKNQVIIEME
ncbi:MAG TPA: acetyl-CoA carboxylase biotin carboxyl carrier protein subunit [Chitinophagales bacterium]|nr:acetyl-CoA carboxylase biotin carboxyl carrier protein subunit [Chitinophagales bacterium]